MRRVTLPPGIRVIPESALGLSVQGNSQGLTPANITVSPDSGTITFIPAPNSDSTVVIPGIVPAPLPQFPQTLITTGKIITTTFDSIAVAISNTNPAVLQPITVTPPAGFHFDSTAGLVFGPLTAIVQSIAAGGTSATFVPLPGSAGHPLVTGLVVNAAPLFVLHLPATLEVTVPPVTPQTGTDNPTTAPVLTVPGVGGSTSINDAGTFDYAAPIAGGGFGTFPARLYKITAATPINLTVTLDWPTGEDLGVCTTAHSPTGSPRPLLGRRPITVALVRIRRPLPPRCLQERISWRW